MNPIIKAAEQMDWMQVVLNQGPPCFHLNPKDDGRFCGRAERWDGHKTWEGSPCIHKFVSLADLLKQVADVEREVNDPAVKDRIKADISKRLEDKP